MPRKKSAPDIDMGPIIDEIINQIRSICEEHEDRALDILSRSETNKLGWGFHATIDNSEAAIIVTTTDKFGENYTTKRTSQLDVGQEKFTPIMDAAKGSKKKGKSAEDVDADE